MFSWIYNDKIKEEWNMNAIILPPTKKEEFHSHGNKLKVVIPSMLTNHNYGLYEIEMEPKARGPKLHYHKLMEETFIVNKGTLTVLTIDGETIVNEGSIIHIPKFAAHGYNNDSDEIVKMTMIFTPGQNREDFFRKLYKALEESPNDLRKFYNIYLENDSYPIDDNNMIPMHK